MSQAAYDGVIESVSGFVEQVSELNEDATHKLTPSVSSMTFYRGQANSEWPLSPKLYREGLFEKESVLISEFMRRAPESFAGMSRFDTLVKMQHYGLPTRMLDTTQNPLVALFFACYDDPERESDGALYIFPSLPVFRQESDPIRIIMKYIFDYPEINVNKNVFIEDANLEYDLDISKENIISRLSVPRHAVLPTMNNARISRQHGSFILYGMNDENEGNEGDYLKFGPVRPKNYKELWHETKVFRVPSNFKSRILEELTLLGVTKSNLFPELEYKAEFVTNFVKRMQF